MEKTNMWEAVEMHLIWQGANSLKLGKAFWLLFFFFVFSSSSYAAILLDRVVAVVNKEVVTWGELYKSMEFDAGSDMRSMSEGEKLKVFKENETQFLESIIDMRLQLQAARSLDITVSKEEIADALNMMKKKSSLGDKEFAESLKKEGFSIEEYRKRMAEQIILSKVVGQQVRSKIVITESEIDNYMLRNKDAGYKISQILIKKSLKFPDQSDLEARANEVLMKLTSGEDFGALARQYSDDPSGKAGGELGFVKKDYLSIEFIEALSVMSPGDVSRPFWTAKGLHIIRLEEKYDASNASELRKIARDKLFDKRFSEEYKSWIRSLREKAYIEVRL